MVKATATESPVCCLIHKAYEAADHATVIEPVTPKMVGMTLPTNAPLLMQRWV
ncbi:hypothetical protein D3C85_1737110 [compost metagenome]